MSETPASHDEARIRQVMDDWLNALCEKQAERVMAHYAENPVLFTLAPPLVTKADDGGEGIRSWFATWRGPLCFEVRDVKITVSGGGRSHPASPACLERIWKVRRFASGFAERSV